MRFVLALLFLLLINHVPSAQAQTDGYDLGPYEIDTGDELSNPRADFWRQVRDGMPGRVNIPNQDKGVLIRQGGNDWANTRSNIVANYGRQVIAVGLALTLIFMFFTGRIRVLSKPVGWTLDKLNPLSRPAHWIAAICFFLLGVTGLNILYGKRVLGPIFGRDFFAEWSYLGKTIHNQASWIFMASIALVMIIKAREYLPGYVKKKVSRKKFLAGKQAALSEKVLFWFAVLGTLIVGYSGSTLLFPQNHNELRDMQLFQLIHSFSALTLTGLIVGNVYIIALGVRENAKKLAEAKDILEEKVKLRTLELQNSNDKLYAEIDHRHQIEDALKVAKNIAEEANLSKDKFLATASHDLLQPLTAARLMIATLRMKELKLDSKELVDQVHHALSGTENLLTDLLDISRLGASTTPPKIEQFNIQQLLGNLENEFRPVARRKGLELRAVGGFGAVESDFQLLSRILRNFLSNAIRYTQSGGVLIGARRRKDHMLIQVWDTGSGIPEEEQDKIFQEFHRLENASLSSETGAGLGLAIVKKISNLLNHPISMKSKHGRGSVFSIEVPLGQAKSVPVAPPKPVMDNDIAGLVIAVIDNDINVLHAIRSYLQEWECHVIAGTSSNDILDQMAWDNNTPDLIISDFHLDHGEIGPNVVKRIRRVYKTEFPAIVISADHTPEMTQFLSDNGLRFLSKPIRPGKMRALISHLSQQERITAHKPAKAIGR